MNNEQKIHIVANIANVTLLVGGTIIHSLLNLSINKHAIVNNQTQ
jgi:acyl dehydratase